MRRTEGQPRRFVRVVLFVTAVVLLAACGVHPDEARSFGEPSGSAAPTATATAGARTPAVFLVKDAQLVPVHRALPDPPSVEDVLTALGQPPTRQEQARGLRTVVGAGDPASPLVTTATSSPVPSPPSGTATSDSAGVVEIVATDALQALPPAQQLFAIAQVTLSLDAAGYDAVSFVDGEGTQLAVPAPGGRALDRPVTAQDYEGLRRNAGASAT